MKKMKSRAIYGAILIFPLLLATIFFSSLAQDVAEGNVIYVRHFRATREAFAYDYQTNERVRVYYDFCVHYSPQLNYVAHFDLENPTQLDFIELATGTILASIPWQAQWGNNYRGGSSCQNSE